MHGQTGDEGERIDERGQDDLAGDVEFGGAAGGGEILHAARRAALLNDTVDNQNGAVGDHAQVLHLRPAAGPGGPAQREQLAGSAN